MQRGKRNRTRREPNRHIATERVFSAASAACKADRRIRRDALVRKTRLPACRERACAASRRSTRRSLPRVGTCTRSAGKLGTSSTSSANTRCQTKLPRCPGVLGGSTSCHRPGTRQRIPSTQRRGRAWLAAGSACVAGTSQYRRSRPRNEMLCLRSSRASVRIRGRRPACPI